MSAAQTRTFVFTFAVTVVILLAGATARAASITNLGVLPGGNASHAYGVSADGSAVVGYNDINYYNGYRAFRWTSAGGMNDLGALPTSTESVAYGVSGDGSVVVGYSFNLYNNYRAFRWTSTGGMKDLGTLPGGGDSYALGANGDGSVIVGSAGEFGADHAFRWTSAAGMQDLGVLPGGVRSVGYGVSGDGSVVAGWSNAGSINHAFRWTSAGGMQDLGTLPGGGRSYALGVSSGGSVIVGYNWFSTGILNAFRWTSAGGMQDLGTLPGETWSKANAVSGDGSIVVGLSGSSLEYFRPFLWTSTLGMVDLNTYLPTQGVDLAGWTLFGAWAISADGTAIVGDGFYNGQQRAWIAVIPEPALLWVCCLGGMLAKRWRSRRFVHVATVRLTRRCSASGAQSFKAAATIVFASLLGSMTTYAASITNLGVLPGGSASFANAVSADGSTVVGSSEVLFHPQAFRWTGAGGMQNLGALPGGMISWGYAVSADGSAVAGLSRNASLSARAFRWTAASGMQNLGVLAGGGDGGSSSGDGMSYDGTTVVGGSNGHAFRWTPSSGMQSMAAPGSTGGDFPTYFSFSTARISGDGSTIAITGHYTPWDGKPYDACTVSSSAGEYQFLFRHFVNALNSNGTRAVGTVDDSPWWDPHSPRAFRWVAGEGTQELGFLPGESESSGIAVSGDGSFVGGESGGRAFLWSGTFGMLDLNSYLPSLDIDLTGWVLTSTTGLSYDGSVVVGNGIYNGQPRGWIAVVPEPTTIGWIGWIAFVTLLPRRHTTSPRSRVRTLVPTLLKEFRRFQPRPRGKVLTVSRPLRYNQP